jgi:hypothetical protein
MAAEKDGCVQAAAGPIDPAGESGAPAQTAAVTREPLRAKVGGAAPDFEVTAYVAGKGFKNVRLSEYKGKWVLLCFYPGDFTFV